MLTSEELFPPEYCFVGRCSSHLAPFLPPPSHHRHSLLPLPSPSRRHCFNETGKCNLFVLPSPLPSQKGLPTVLSPLFAIPFSALPSSPARLVSPSFSSTLAENRSRQFSNHFYAAPPAPRRFPRLVEWRTSITMGYTQKRPVPASLLPQLGVRCSKRVRKK